MQNVRAWRKVRNQNEVIARAKASTTVALRRFHGPLSPKALRACRAPSKNTPAELFFAETMSDTTQGVYAVFTEQNASAPHMTGRSSGDDIRYTKNGRRKKRCCLHRNASRKMIRAASFLKLPGVGVSRTLYQVSSTSTTIRRWENIRDSVVPAPPLWELIHVVEPQVVNVAKADLEHSRKKSHVGNKSDFNPQIGQFGRDTSQSSEFLSPNAPRSNGRAQLFVL